MGVWLTDAERQVLEAVCAYLIPEDQSPGAAQAGVVDYIDNLLGAFLFDPPRIWAGGPTSGRAGGEGSFGRFVALGPLDELAWRMRIEGSQGIAEREFNGPVVGLQQRYREGLAALGEDFGQASVDDQRQALHDQRQFADLVYEHACEGMYGAPEYGGNRDQMGWRSIGFAGDVQPRGWSDEEVSAP